MQIGELARLTGCAVDTIRYYEKQSLLPPPARSAGNFRDYADSHVHYVALEGKFPKFFEKRHIR